MAYSKWQTENKLPSVKVWHMSTPLQFLIAVVLLVIVVFFVWVLFSPKTASLTDAQHVPIVQAPPGPTRIRPDSPGAPEIPYQDKKIYQEFSPQNGATPDAEPLMYEQPEEPLVLRESGFSTDPAQSTGEITTNTQHPETNDLISTTAKPVVMLTEKSAQNAVNIRLQPDAKNPDSTQTQDALSKNGIQKNTSSQTTSGVVRLKRKPRPKL